MMYLGQIQVAQKNSAENGFSKHKLCLNLAY